MSNLEIKIVNKNGTPAQVSDENRLLVEATASPGPGSLATETTLASIDTTLTPQVRVPSLARVSTIGVLSGPLYSVSVANVGAADGTLLGTTLKVNETVNFDAGAIGNTFGNIAYDASGTEFLISIIS